MNWGPIVRHAAIIIGAVFVASAMAYLAVRLITFELGRAGRSTALGGLGAVLLAAEVEPGPSSRGPLNEFEQDPQGQA
jgi:hypothetical protein